MLVRDLSATTLCFVAWLFVLEIGVRVTADPRPEMYDYIHDGSRGWAFPPHGHGWANTDNPTYVQLNSAGYNDEERSLSRKPGVVRIAVLGDSMTAATMVPRDKIFTAVMERRLVGTEVLNFGVNAYNLEQCRRLLNEVVWRYDPQIVVLLASIENGIAYSVRELGYADDSSAPYMIQKGDRLVADAKSARMVPFSPQRVTFENTYADLANSSRLFLLFDRAYGRLRAHLVPHKLPMKKEQYERFIKVRPYDPEVNSNMVRAWDVSEKMLTLFRDQVRAHGSDFVIALPALPMQAAPSIPDREYFRKKIGVTSLYLSNDKLDSFCRREKIPIIDMSRSMGDYALAHHIALYGFGADLHGSHWNERGNLVAGEIVSRALADLKPDLLKYSDRQLTAPNPER